MAHQGIHAKWDAITLEHLREVGGAKWSRFPEHIGSFIAEMDFGIDPAITQCIIDYATSERHGYATPPWPEHMANAFAQFAQQRYGWTIDPAMVKPVPDVINGLEIFLETFVNPGDPVIVPTPAYMAFFGILRNLNHPIIEVPSHPENNWAMDLDGIDRAFAQGATSIILCNPHNPTGRVFSQAELAALSEIVERHNGLVFNDEIHAPITLFGHKHIPYPMVNDQAKHHCVTATSPSKAWNIPGHRCAQLVFTNPEHERTFMQSAAFRFCDRVPNLGLFTNTAAYTKTPNWLHALIPYLETNVGLLDEAITNGQWPGVKAGRDYHRGEGTYLAWVNLENTPAANDPGEYLATHAKVKAIGGKLCGQGWASYLRLNMATPTPIWREVITRIGQALA